MCAAHWRRFSEAFTVMIMHKTPFARLSRNLLWCGALLAACPAWAQIYTWTDKDGRTHYSDTPPKTGEVKVVSPARRTPPQTEPARAEAEKDAAQPATAPSLADREAEFRKRRAEEAEAKAKAEAEAKRAQERGRACSQARAQLAALQSGQRVARFKEDGSGEILDDAQRVQETEKVQAYIEQECR